MKNEKNKKDKYEESRNLPLYIEKICTWNIEKVCYKQENSTNCTLILMQKGQIFIKADGKRGVLKLHEGIIIHSTLNFEMSIQENTEAECIIVSFSGTGTNDIFSYLGLEKYHVFSAHGNVVSLNMDELLYNFYQGNFFGAAIMLQMILRNACAVTKVRASNMEDIRQYILKHYNEEVDLNVLAALYGTSISYFCREFKKYYHVTPMNYVNGIRIMRAKILLESSSMKVIDIAAACGYEKLEYFCYVFKKSEGCTPLQFRNGSSDL